jgi:hypothetical protein
LKTVVIISSIKDKKSYENVDKSKRKESDSKTESHFDYGSFHIGKSNFFRGRIESINEGSPNIEPRINLIPHLYSPSEGSPMVDHKVSTFRKYSLSGREITSLKDHQMMRENPSISISVHKDSKGGSSFQEVDGILTKSSRTNSKLSKFGASNLSQNQVQESQSQESFGDPDGEYSPVHRNLPRLRSTFLRNPFLDEDESMLHIKMSHLKSNSVSVRSINSRVFEEKRSLSRTNRSSKLNDSDELPQKKHSDNK